MRFSRCKLGLSGLEPPTSRLSGVRSNRLSYNPLMGPAATYSPVSSPIQYLRPIWSSPSCSGWERVLPHTVSPPEIFGCLVVHSFLQVTLPSPQVTRYAPHLVPGRVPYTNLLPSQSLHASMQACSFKRLLQEL